MAPPYLGDPKLASEVSKPLGYALLAASGKRICSAPCSTMNLAFAEWQSNRQATIARLHHLSSMSVI